MAHSRMQGLLLLLLVGLPAAAVLAVPRAGLIRAHSVGVHICARSAGARARARVLAREEEPTLASKGAWYAAELFGKVAALGRQGAAAPSLKGPPKSLREAVARLEADYERSYFILGRMDEALYAADCEFADPFVSFKGTERFVANLANLAGGFITDSRVRTLSAGADGPADARPSYTTRLLVKLRLALPWRPVLAWVWGVTHEFDAETLLVVRHVERWEVSAAEGVRQLLTPGPERGLEQGRPQPSAAAPEPAPPKPQLDPVIGPLVRLARAAGVLQPEADGWEGEPSAWAAPDSLAQRLSSLTAETLRPLKQAVAEAAAGSFEPAPIDARIAAESASAPVFLYTFSTCPFCKRAKELLAEEGAAFAEVQLDALPDGPAIRARLGRLTGRTSLPAIWVGGQFVGGCNDGPAGGPQGIASLAARGELTPLLCKAGALSKSQRR